MGIELFSCPRCQNHLLESADALSCSACGARYSTNDGVYNFLTNKSNHGEFDRKTMIRIISFARENGWRRAMDEVIKPLQPKVVQLITDRKRELSLQPLSCGGDAVLDFGCGYGGVSLVLARKFKKVVSLDGSIERVSFLNIVKQQEKIENIQTVCHIEPLQMPFADDAFDAIVMIGVFEYLPSNLPDMTISAAHHACLRSLRRILKPGGKLLIHTKNRFGWNFLLGGRDHNGVRFGPALPLPLADLMKRFSGRDRYRIVNYSTWQYRKMLRKAGFEFAGMYWPFPGYQDPHYLVDLGKNVRRQIAKFETDKCAASKRNSFEILARLRVLPHVAPHLTLLATK